MAALVAPVVLEAITPDTAPLPDEAYRRLDYVESRVPVRGWRAELDLTTAAAEARVVGRAGRATVAGYVRRSWERDDTEAGVRVSVPFGRR